MNTWEAMKKTSDQEELKELQNIELKHLKEKQMFFSSTPPEKRKDTMRNNINVRKEVTKILKTYDAVNDFMYARDWDSYQKKVSPTVQLKPQPKLEDNINKDRKGLDTIVYYNQEDKVKADQIKKEAVEFGDPSTWDKHVNQFIDDAYKGIGSMETPNNITKEAFDNLKDN